MIVSCWGIFPGYWEVNHAFVVTGWCPTTWEAYLEAGEQ